MGISVGKQTILETHSCIICLKQSHNESFIWVNYRQWSKKMVSLDIIFPFSYYDLEVNCGKATIHVDIYRWKHVSLINQCRIRYDTLEINVSFPGNIYHASISWSSPPRLLAEPSMLLIHILTTALSQRKMWARAHISWGLLGSCSSMNSI